MMNFPNAFFSIPAIVKFNNDNNCVHWYKRGANVDDNDELHYTVCDDILICPENISHITSFEYFHADINVTGTLHSKMAQLAAHCENTETLEPLYMKFAASYCGDRLIEFCCYQSYIEFSVRNMDDNQHSYFTITPGPCENCESDQS
jgi:hypothetical protein